jgi:hypothetical protein
MSAPAIATTGPVQLAITLHNENSSTGTVPHIFPVSVFFRPVELGATFVYTTGRVQKNKKQKPTKTPIDWKMPH